MPREDTSNDEALAKALQLEFEQEYRPRRSARPSAPVESDEDLARRLADEENRRASTVVVPGQSVYRSSADRQSRTSLSAAQYRAQTSTVSTSPSRTSTNSNQSIEVTAAVPDDTEYARRIEQELRDEDVARELTRREQEAISRSQAHRMSRTRQRRKCSLGCMVGYLIPLALLLGGAGGLWYWLVYKDGDTGWIPKPEDFRREDPFNAKTPDDADKWNTRGRGLTLTIANALDERWHGYFNLAVQQWDNGDPDALTLSSTTRSYEYECEPERSLLKVCNGDYGNEPWRGINKILLSNGYIIASAARMNEYHLARSSDDQKQYTMCHEIGHGFGLPHTDENFNNRDLGNCMDYTSNPRANKQPSVDNFNFLVQLYGTVDGSTVVSSTESIPFTRGGNRRALETEELPADVLDAWYEMDAMVSNRALPDGARMLHESDHGQAFELDVGDGYTIRTHMLLA